MWVQWVCSRERRIALYKRHQSINHCDINIYLLSVQSLTQFTIMYLLFVQPLAYSAIMYPLSVQSTAHSNIVYMLFVQSLTYPLRDIIIYIYIYVFCSVSYLLQYSVPCLFNLLPTPLRYLFNLLLSVLSLAYSTIMYLLSAQSVTYSTVISVQSLTYSTVIYICSTSDLLHCDNCCLFNLLPTPPRCTVALSISYLFHWWYTCIYIYLTPIAIWTHNQQAGR